MIRTQICLTINEQTKLKEEALILGISMAELIRRVLDSYLKEKDEKKSKKKIKAVQ